MDDLAAWVVVHDCQHAAGPQQPPALSDLAGGEGGVHTGGQLAAEQGAGSRRRAGCHLQSATTAPLLFALVRDNLSLPQPTTRPPHQVFDDRCRALVCHKLHSDLLGGRGGAGGGATGEGARRGGALCRSRCRQHYGSAAVEHSVPHLAAWGWAHARRRCKTREGHPCTPLAPPPLSRSPPQRCAPPCPPPATLQLLGDAPDQRSRRAAQWTPCWRACSGCAGAACGTGCTERSAETEGEGWEAAPLWGPGWRTTRHHAQPLMSSACSACCIIVGAWSRRQGKGAHRAVQPAAFRALPGKPLPSLTLRRRPAAAPAARPPPGSRGTCPGR